MEFAFTVSFKFTSSWLSFAILFILIVFPDENICVFHCTSLEQSRPRARETGYETLFLCHSSTLDLYTESLIVWILFKNNWTLSLATQCIYGSDSLVTVPLGLLWEWRWGGNAGWTATVQCRGQSRVPFYNVQLDYTMVLRWILCPRWMSHCKGVVANQTHPAKGREGSFTGPKSRRAEVGVKWGSRHLSLNNVWKDFYWL